MSSTWMTAFWIRGLPFYVSGLACPIPRSLSVPSASMHFTTPTTMHALTLFLHLIALSLICGLWSSRSALGLVGYVLNGPTLSVLGQPFSSISFLHLFFCVFRMTQRAVLVRTRRSPPKYKLIKRRRIGGARLTLLNLRAVWVPAWILWKGSLCLPRLRRRRPLPLLASPSSPFSSLPFSSSPPPPHLYPEDDLWAFR